MWGWRYRWVTPKTPVYECADTNLTCEEAIYKRYNIGKTTQLIPRIRVKVKNDDEGGGRMILSSIIQNHDYLCYSVSSENDAALLGWWERKDGACWFSHRSVPIKLHEDTARRKVFCQLASRDLPEIRIYLKLHFMGPSTLCERSCIH